MVGNNIEKINPIDVSAIELEKSLSVLDEPYIKHRSLLDDFSLAKLPTLDHDDGDGLLNQIYVIGEWLSLIEYHETYVSDCCAFLHRLQSTLRYYLDLEKLQIEYESKDAYSSKAEMKRLIVYHTRLLSEKDMIIGKQIILWNSLKDLYKKRSVDLKFHVRNAQETLKSLRELKPQNMLRKEPQANSSVDNVERKLNKYRCPSDI